jgi:MSHA biogenesis protein MshI
MQFFKKKAKSNSRVGVLVSSDQLAVAWMGERDGAPYLIAFERVALQSEQDAGMALSKLVKSMKIEGKECSYVLNRKDYNLHLVEAPEVEPSELRAAVRWKIKDLLDMKVEDAALDVFQVPTDAYRGRNMVYVVAALKSKIKDIVEMVNESGLEMAVIDIPELVMRNLSNHCIDDKNGVAFIDLRRNGSTMNITRQGELYLSRRINTQLDPKIMQSIAWESLKDRLALEIQRSLDYYESQMGQIPINRIVIAQRQYDGAALAAELNGVLSAEVSVLSLSDHLNSTTELTAESQQIGMAAIGATLRTNKKSGRSRKPKQEAA